MRVWILHVGEELPVDQDARLFRYGYLAQEIAERGHEVLRWAPTFQHFRKRQRFDSDKRVDVGPGYEIQFVHARGYRRNVSLARWRSYQTLGRRVREMFATETPPDLILTGIPSLEWCEAAIGYGQEHGVPVVLDVRDLWPDVYLGVAPRRLRPAARWALGPLFNRAERVCRGAAAITGVSRSYLEWGLNNAGRESTVADRVFPLGRQPSDLSAAELAAEVETLQRRGVDSSKTVCLFVGLLEKSYDIEALALAANRLECQAPGRYQLVVCGDGSKRRLLQRHAESSSNLLPLGWVTPAAIAAALSLSAVGLAAYTADAPQSLPNKPFEYLSGGLPVVTSLTGELPALLSKHRCGGSYEAGDSESLADAVLRLTSDTLRLAGYQRNARRLFEERFRADKITAEFADYLLGLPEELAPRQLTHAA